MLSSILDVYTMNLCLIYDQHGKFNNLLSIFVYLQVKLEFHETFQPEMTYVAKLVKLASENYAGTKFEISECTGIPTGKQKGKVVPHIRYASCMGLID